jgi:hypothetical protein
MFRFETFKNRVKKVVIRQAPKDLDKPKRDFGGSGITEECYEWILNNVQPGAKVLEFGAGLVSTRLLSTRYELTSVEDNEEYLNTFNAKYLHAPLDETTGWYESDSLREIEDIAFELTILDGPKGSGNRFGILLHMNYIENSTYILVDDTDRPPEKVLALLIAKNLTREIRHFDTFSVIL